VLTEQVKEQAELFVHAAIPRGYSKNGAGHAGLRRAGCCYPDVRNYDGSWTEWGSAIGVAVEKRYQG
jgi:3-mercaptopyruvate sulfurtransferase SseA